MVIDLTGIVTALIGLLATVITTALVPFIKTKFDDAKYCRIINVVTAAVEAAEQMFAGSGLGAQKKEYVINYLKGKGFKIDGAELDIMIESSVLELKNVILP